MTVSFDAQAGLKCALSSPEGVTSEYIKSKGISGGILFWVQQGFPVEKK
jgi:hypothetical protein